VSRPEPRASDRAGDADREAARARVVEAYARGRLDGADLEARADALVAARTYADLDRIVGDLPVERPADGPAVGEPLERRRLLRDVAFFLVASLACVLLWWLGGRGLFWPLWVIVYTGIQPLVTAWALLRRPHPEHRPG